MYSCVNAQKAKESNQVKKLSCLERDSNLYVYTGNESLTVLFLQKQGDEQVSSRSEAAFPVAGVAVSLCVSFPELRELMLAHFHASCPVLVPFYAQNKGLSDVERYRYSILYGVSAYT